MKSTNEQLLERIQELESENKALRNQLHRESGSGGTFIESKTKYASRIFETLPDMMTIWSNSGVIQDMISAEKVNHMGMPASELIGANIQDLLPDDAYAGIRENLNQVLKTHNESTGFHNLIVDGELRHYENRIWPLDQENVLCMCRDITEAIRTRQAMDEASKRMKMIEKVASLGYWFYYAETNEFYAPDIISKLLEIDTPTDYLNADTYFESYVHPDDRDKARTLLTPRHASQNEEDYIEFRIITQKNKIKHLRHSVFCEVTTNGKRTIEGYVQDVTSIIERYHELEILKYVVNNASEQIFSFNMDGTLCFANDVFRRDHAITDDITHYTFQDLYPEMEPESHFENIVKRLKANQGTLNTTNTHRLAQGELITQEAMITLLNDTISQQSVVWFFCRNITQRIRQGNELKELNRLLEAILENIPVYLFVKDPNREGRYLYWNKSFVKHSGIPASQVIGRTDYEVFPRRIDAEQFIKDDTLLLQQGYLPPREEEYVSASGEKRIVHTIKMLVPIEEHKLPLLMGISWDITQQKVIEQELINAKMKAEQSDQLKTAFLANMSHEIRTPLNAIVGFAKILPEITDSTERTSITNIIDSNSDQLLMLINDILDLAKIEAGTIEFVIAPTDLTELCQNIHCTLLEKTAPGVALIYEGALDHTIADCDPGRLSQVIINLITNAIKFTKEGSIRYGYEVKDSLVEFHITDTGIGIPEDKLNTIFKRFTKLNTFISGTGLGLAICKMIIERKHGKIWAESTIGKGSSFRFQFPLSQNNGIDI